MRPRTLYHKSVEVVEDWVRLLKLESGNISFDEKYVRGRKLGNGKFSVVY